MVLACDRFGPGPVLLPSPDDSLMVHGMVAGGEHLSVLEPYVVVIEVSVLRHLGEINSYIGSNANVGGSTFAYENPRPLARPGVDWSE